MKRCRIWPGDDISHVRRRQIATTTRSSHVTQEEYICYDKLILVNSVMIQFPVSAPLVHKGKRKTTLSRESHPHVLKHLLASNLKGPIYSTCAGPSSVLVIGGAEPKLD
jgi:hypothetical protein